MKWYILVSVIVFVMWYQHSLERNERLGYDFRIYYEAGRGNLGYTTSDGLSWLYPNNTRFAFTPLGWLSFRWAFFVFYLVEFIAWGYICKRLYAFGSGGIIISVLCLYPVLLTLESGNISLILSALCLNPVGVVVAGLFKPYYLVFLVLHVAKYVRGRTLVGVRAGKEESDVIGSRVYSSKINETIEKLYI